jgi:hypothetical protein
MGTVPTGSTGAQSSSHELHYTTHLAPNRTVPKNSLIRVPAGARLFREKQLALRFTHWTGPPAVHAPWSTLKARLGLDLPPYRRPQPVDSKVHLPSPPLGDENAWSPAPVWHLRTVTDSYMLTGETLSPAYRRDSVWD